MLVCCSCWMHEAAFDAHSGRYLEFHAFTDKVTPSIWHPKWQFWDGRPSGCSVAITWAQGRTAASTGAVSAPWQLPHLLTDIYITMTVIKASRVCSTPCIVCVAFGALPKHCMEGNASSMSQALCLKPRKRCICFSMWGIELAFRARNASVAVSTSYICTLSAFMYMFIPLIMICLHPELNVDKANTNLFPLSHKIF